MTCYCSICKTLLSTHDGQLPSDRICPDCRSKLPLATPTSPIVLEMAGNWWPDRFEFLEHLGRGGFGDVWKAHDGILNRVVALKVPRTRQLSAIETDLFLRDARFAARLCHPNIVTVYEVGEHCQIPFIVSEYIAGRDLKSWLRDAPQDWIRIAKMMQSIALTVDYAHQNGVVHRDLKPGNMIIDGEGRPHLLDFGLSKSLSSDATLSIEGNVFGTPAYMSPEQACGDGRYADARCDLYSLGVVMFELLTGEQPFQGERQPLIWQIITQDPPQPRHDNPAIPFDLQTICLKCLEKDPKKRYPTAGELAADLRRFVAGEPIHARPIGPMGRLVKLARRRPAQAMGFVSLMLAAIIVTGGSLLYQSRLNQANLNLTKALTEVTRQSNVLSQRDAAAKRQLYLNDVHQAGRAWQAGDLSEMEMLLQRQIPQDGVEDLRGFEWYHLRRRCRMSPTFRWKVHQGQVYSLDFAPDGKTLASGGQDGIVSLHHMDGTRIWQVQDSDRAIESVAFSPDGHWLVSAGEDGEIRIRNSTDGALQTGFPAHTTTVTALSFHPEGNRFVSSSYSGEIAFWDVPSGKLVQRITNLSNGAISTVAYSADGTRLATGCTFGSLKVTEAATGKLLWEFQQPGAVKQLAFPHALSELATAGSDNVVRVFPQEGQQPSHDLTGFSDAVTSLAFTRDDHWLVAASKPGKIQIWDLETLQLQGVLQAPGGRVFSVACSPQADLIATAEGDGGISFWDFQETDRMIAAETFHAGGPMEFCPTGKLLVALIGNRLAVLPTDSCRAGRLFPQFFGDDPIPSQLRLPVQWIQNQDTKVFAISPCGRFLAAGLRTDSIEILATDSGQVVCQLSSPVPSAEILSIDFSPDSREIVVGTGDGHVQIWSIETQRARISCPIPKYTAVKAHWSPTGQKLICFGNSSWISVIDAQTGELTFYESRSQGLPTVATFSPDGVWYFLGSHAGTVEVWQCDPMVRLRTLHPTSSSIADLAVSPDGKTLAIAWENFVGLWNIPAWGELLIIPCRPKNINSISFSPRGEILAVQTTADTKRTARGYLSEIEFLFGR